MFARLLPVDLFRQRALIYQLARREILGRYRGSWLGLAWSFVTPLLMLTVYTFVFSVIFNARWAGTHPGKLEFALMVFAGMVAFLLCAEVLGRAPALLLQYTSYVKKVVFPLDTLPLVLVGSALFHALAGLAVLLLFVVFSRGLGLTVIALPLVLLPLVLLLAGLAWALAALGVYFRDLGQAVGLLLTMLQFLSPVFYPLDAVPELFRPFMAWSPLTIPIEALRAILLRGAWPAWDALLGYWLVAVFIAWLGHRIFVRLRGGFADVL
ncbi:ABC transporter permease [Chitinimonas naiadis]